MFGDLIEVASGPDFLKAVDDEHKDVTVFIHLYEPDNRACATLNNCLRSLASDYARGFKFCKYVKL
jgi:thioredoxin-like negative regulator of GroEL